jgi:hypothetical protein
MDTVAETVEIEQSDGNKSKTNTGARNDSEDGSSTGCKGQAWRDDKERTPRDDGSGKEERRKRRRGESPELGGDLSFVQVNFLLSKISEGSSKEREEARVSAQKEQQRREDADKEAQNAVLNFRLLEKRHEVEKELAVKHQAAIVAEKVLAAENVRKKVGAIHSVVLKCQRF